MARPVSAALLAGGLTALTACPDPTDPAGGTTGAGEDTTTDALSTSTDTADGSESGPLSDGGDSSGAATDPTSTTEGGEESSTGQALAPIDCAAAPLTATEVTQLDGPRGYHGLVITPDGLMIGSDGTSLLQSTYDGDVSVFVPGLGWGQMMDWLPDGDFVHLTDDGALSRIGLDATVHTITPDVWAYGLRTGPDGMVYVVGRNIGIHRIDPLSGEQTLLFAPPPGLDNETHAVGFSPDGSRMYVGTIGLAGTILYADFDAAMDPITGLEVFTHGVAEEFQWHDEVVVDICGNLLVTDYESSNVYRVTPDGEVGVFWDPPSDTLHAHAAVWGTGEHGWRSDAIYVPQPYNENTVSEIVVGVPGQYWPGPTINATPMLP